MKYSSLTALCIALALAACQEGDSASSGTTTNGGTVNNSNTPADASVSDSGDVSQPSSEEGDAESSNFFYFSYDDSASTASKSIAVTAIGNGYTPSQDLGRAYEFLNAERFTHFNEEDLGPFSVSMGLHQTDNIDIPLQASDLDHELNYALGVNLSGPSLTKASRPNVVLTVLVDISGSMESYYSSQTGIETESLLDVVKHGLTSMPQSLKEGDVINLVTFDDRTTVVLEAAAYNDSRLVGLVNDLSTRGSTNIDLGISAAYDVAIRNYDSEKSNRVVIITDAYANTGQIDSTVISQNVVINGLEGIHFAGIGVGSNFNDAFLNNLTDIGRGAYSAMVSPSDAVNIFTEGFMRFVDHAVGDVRFKLTYPGGLEHLITAAEEVSQNEDDVQTINFSYNDSQFFLEVFGADAVLADDAEFELEVSYKDDDGNAQLVQYTKSVEEILGQGREQIYTAAAVASLAGLINGTLNCTDTLSTNLATIDLNAPLLTEYQDLISAYCLMR